MRTAPRPRRRSPASWSGVEVTSDAEYAATPATAIPQGVSETVRVLDQSSGDPGAGPRDDSHGSQQREHGHGLRHRLHSTPPAFYIVEITLCQPIWFTQHAQHPHPEGYRVLITRSRPSTATPT